MINIAVTKKSVKELVSNKEVNVIVHGCNCFHKMIGPVSDSLRQLTDNNILVVDVDGSSYGDINKLGSWTSGGYEFAGHAVDIFNLYCSYTYPAAGCDAIHWASVNDALVEIISNIESGHVMGVEHIGFNSLDKTEFMSVLNDIADRYDNELPDVNVVVFEK